MSFREPTPEEVSLLQRLAEIAGLADDWIDGLLVEDMADGGMGSLRLLSRGAGAAHPGLGTPVAFYEYRDLDDIPVQIQLFLDEEGRPAELDSWKVDFSPIQSRSGK